MPKKEELFCEAKECVDKAYHEVFYFDEDGTMWWSYLCREHFEWKREAGKLEGWGGVG